MYTYIRVLVWITSRKKTIATEKQS